MGAIDNFLRRFGYAKVDRFGLVLTGDDRVLSTRPAVLDDGLGGKIVGWLDGDLAAMELEHWGAPKKQPPAKPLAAPRRLQPASRPTLPGVSPFAETVAAPVVKAVERPIVQPVVQPVVAAVAAPAPARAPVVAAEPELTEDEWEWEIAMARARAAAEDVQEAAASIATSFTAPKRTTSRGLPAPVAPLAAAAAPKIEVERKTIIPVPQLPVAARPSDVRPAPYTPSQPRRMPKGTARLEDTVRTQAAPPANDDATSPYVTLPPEVKPVGYASTRRVAAKQR